MESDNYETSSPSSMCSSEDELHHAYSMTDMLDELNEHGNAQRLESLPKNMWLWLMDSTNLLKRNV